MITISKYEKKQLDEWDQFINASNNGTMFQKQRFINYHIDRKFVDNSLIIKKDNYLEAINILNGNTFWLIDSKLNKKSKILNINNVNKNLYIFLNNGKIALINNNIISEILDLKVKKINSIDFINNKIIAKLENGKIVIF